MATQQNTQQRRFIWKDLAFTTSSSMKASFRGLGGGVGKKKGGIEGTWSPPDEESKVTIHRDEKTGSLVGRISWLKDSERVHQRDFRNPRRELRDRTLLGLPILQNFREDGEHGNEGLIYDPNHGWSIKGKLQLNDKGDKLKVKGWMGIGPLKVSRSYTWSKIT